MYFLLKETKGGALRVSEIGLRRFVQEILRRNGERAVCSSFVLDGENAIAALDVKSGGVERVVGDIMGSMGINVRFVQVSDAAPDVAFAEKIYVALRSPWFWAGACVSVALLVSVGLKGLFWLSFWGSVGWFAAQGKQLFK